MFALKLIIPDKVYNESGVKCTTGMGLIYDVKVN